VALAFVIVERGDRKDLGKRYPLDEVRVVIGRESPQGAPDIAINDDFVSRRHAEITHEQGRFWLRDLGSTNGTSIDQERIEPDRLYPLAHDAIIGLGVKSGTARVLLRFNETPSGSTAPMGPNGIGRPTSWLAIDREKQEIEVDGKQVMLSRKEYDLIACLESAAGRTCGRDELIAAAWPEAIDPAGVSDAAVDQLVHRLRQKVERDPTRPERIVSRKGFGYMLVKTAPGE
jgi:FHA domain